MSCISPWTFKLQIILELIVFNQETGASPCQESHYYTTVSPSNTTTLFYSEMIKCFSLKCPSSGHHYQLFKIRYNAVQIMLIKWGPYNSQNLCKTVKKLIGLVMSWLVTVSKLCIKTSNISRKIIHKHWNEIFMGSKSYWVTSVGYIM